MWGEQGAGQTVSALIRSILILSGVKHILRPYHPLACSFLHSPSECQTWGEQRVLMPAGPGCLTPSSCAAAAVTAHRGIRENLHFLTWGFGGWFYLLFGVGGCRAFACSGFGFLCVCMFGFFVCFFFQQWPPFTFSSFPAETSIIIITC